MKRLYHVSFKCLGDRPLFKPRIPDNRYDGEDIYHPYLDRDFPENDTVKRICVSNSVMGCLRAIPVQFREYYVYEAIEPMVVTRDIPLYMVPDAKETGEHWILNNTYMQKVGKIHVNSDKHWHVINYRWIERIYKKSH